MVIVVAIAVAASSLRHGISQDHILESVLGYSLTFFAVWWAWMSFTWFAAGHDTDDVPYRIAVFVQMAGAIIIAAGIGRAFDSGDWSVVLVGYLVMRAALVLQWLRAAHDDSSHRSQNTRWAAGIGVMQVLWVLAVLFVPPDLFLPAFLGLAAGELAVPILASRGSQGVWHVEHIAERYGLLTSRARAFEWGYGHYFIWAAAAAVGAGIAVGVDVLTREAEVGLPVARAAVAIPVAIYLAGVWVLHDAPRAMPHSRMALGPVAIVLVLLTPLTPQPIFLTGVIVVVLLAAKIATAPQAES